ncbi:MAG: hypothetical protein LBE97_01995 [Holosporales bacterium]|jgi:hypothetical protein|nr:hypothetical protein [Holosporales bacterium]
MNIKRIIQAIALTIPLASMTVNAAADRPQFDPSEKFQVPYAQGFNVGPLSNPLQGAVHIVGQTLNGLWNPEIYLTEQWAPLNRLVPFLLGYISSADHASDIGAGATIMFPRVQNFEEDPVWERDIELMQVVVDVLETLHTGEYAQTFIEIMREYQAQQQYSTLLFNVDRWYEDSQAQLDTLKAQLARANDTTPYNGGQPVTAMFLAEKANGGPFPYQIPNLYKHYLEDVFNLWFGRQEYPDSLWRAMQGKLTIPNRPFPHDKRPTTAAEVDSRFDEIAPLLYNLVATQNRE